MNEARTTSATGPEVVGEFGNIVAGLTRFLNRLSTIPQFRAAQLGLAEWVALSVLQQSDGVNNKFLSIQLGVTRQRAHQLVNQLVSAELISVKVSPRDSRENVITLAPKGKKQLEILNREISALLSKSLGPRTRILSRIQKQIPLLMRIPKTAKSPNEQMKRPPRTSPPDETIIRPLRNPSRERIRRADDAK